MIKRKLPLLKLEKKEKKEIQKAKKRDHNLISSECVFGMLLMMTMVCIKIWSAKTWDAQKTSHETNLLRNENWKTLGGEEIQHEWKLQMKFGSQDFLLS